MAGFSRFSLPPLEKWPPALRFFLKPYYLGSRVAFAVILVFLIALVYFLDSRKGNVVDFRPFYGIIVLVAFTIFRLQGIWWLLAAVISRQINLSARHYVPIRFEFLDELVAILSFGMVGFLIAAISDGLRDLARSQEMIRKDLALAGDLQQRILPAPLHRAWISIEGRLRPTGEVGGDFYVIEPIENDAVLFAIGDVEGKGVAAALIMAKIMVLIAEMAKKLTPIAEIVSRVNSHLCQVNHGTVTLFIGIATRISGGEVRFSYARSGHENGFLIKRNGCRQELTSTETLPLGIFSDKKYDVHTVFLQPFDRIFLYTDGLPDQRDANLEAFGREKLAERVGTLAEKVEAGDVGKWLDSIMEDLEAYRGIRFQEDDMAALAMIVLPNASNPSSLQENFGATRNFA